MAPSNLHLYGYWASGGIFKIRLVNGDTKHAALIYEGTIGSEAETRWEDVKRVVQISSASDFSKAWNSPGNPFDD